MSIVVLGSMNMDLVARTPRLPAPGETLTGSAFFTNPGGKGGNQAVAAARLGVPVRMVGRVGGDAFGRELLERLRAVGVDTSGICVDASCSSGTAVIEVANDGENRIIVIPGANGRVGKEDVTRMTALLAGASVLMLQLEVPLETVAAAAEAARAQGVTVILDPAPAQVLSDDLCAQVDIITPNQVEAECLTGIPVSDDVSARRAGEALVAKGIGQVVVKMGGLGVVWTDGTRSVYVPAFKVHAVDTVAAGDAFNGALAAALAEGHPMADALHWGAAGGALSVMSVGAQQSMANRAELLAFLKGRCP